MTAAVDQNMRRYHIGEVDVSLTSTVRGIVEEHAALYRGFEVDPAVQRSAAAIRLSVEPTPFSLVHRRRYIVRVNHRVQFEPARTDEVIPYVEWAINFEVPHVLPAFLQLHASSLELGGAGVVLAGESGSGKSTLAAGLLTRGWRYLCDEFALINIDTLNLHPYPRAICLKKPSHEAVESLGLTLHGSKHYHKGSKGYVGFVNARSLGAEALGRACPVRYVIFPQYRAGARPELVPLSRPEAVFKLHGVCFNLLTCHGVGLNVLVGLVRGARCFRLISGELGATCDLLEALMSSRGGLAKSA
ncbi:MAG: hypothetical protein ACE5E5_11130 [Phycisphaerae bacterium]